MAQPDAIEPAVLLEIASRRYVAGGSLEHAVAAELGITEVRFWQQVNRLLDEPSAGVAVEYGPELNRLRRLRDARQRHRRSP